LLISATNSQAIIEEYPEFEKDTSFEEFSYRFSFSGEMPIEMRMNLDQITRTPDVADALQDLASQPHTTTVQGQCTPKICEVSWKETTKSDGSMQNDYGLALDVLTVNGGSTNGTTTETAYSLKVPCEEVKGLIEILRKKRKD